MERWETVEQIADALVRIEGANPGYRTPRAHGMVVNGAVVVWNVENHPLPAAVMAATLGHDGSTAAIALSDQQLDDAIAALTPAEACRAYDHPNLEAWREARANDAEVVVVFVA
jgi:hypothetical protein